MSYKNIMKVKDMIYFMYVFLFRRWSCDIELCIVYPDWLSLRPVKEKSARENMEESEANSPTAAW